ncbi:MAG: DUF2249 domain-containing protein [Candidatus Lambdaproteobacteria bacterium]|nr:DUF2249 domain-containing protein [Candidatus Lambdaproteobacteria bacterium]
MIELRPPVAPEIDFWRDDAGYHLDVRRFLFAGGRPFAVIVDCVSQLAPGERLSVHAPFEPKPLLVQMRRRGYSAASASIEPDHWVVRIERPH